MRGKDLQLCFYLIHEKLFCFSPATMCPLFKEVFSAYELELTKDIWEINILNPLKQ